MKPRVIVAIGDMLGCGYYRCALPYRALAKVGFDVTLTNVLSPDITKTYDALILQRQHAEGVVLNAEEYKRLRPDGKIVFEFDDNLHSIPPSNPASQMYRKGSVPLKNMERLMRMADLLTVSTPGLKQEYSKLNSNISICYNALDGQVVPLIDAISDPLPHNGDFRLGWGGSATHHDDFQKVIKPLTALLTENRGLRFVFLGADMRRMFPVTLHRQLEHLGDTFPKDHNGSAVPYSAKYNPTVEYYKLLKRANLDAAIAPIESYTFNRCKSYIKLMEYGMAKIPFVASRFGPYTEYVGSRRGELGLLAETDKEWKRAITDLMVNPDLRERLKVANYQNVLDNHLVDHKIGQWLTAFESIGLVPGDEPGHYEEKIDNSQRVA